MGAFSQLLAKHNVQVRRGAADNHRQQGIVERFTRTLAERIFGHQYAQEMLLAVRGSSERSIEWVTGLRDQADQRYRNVVITNTFFSKGTNSKQHGCISDRSTATCWTTI